MPAGIARFCIDSRLVEAGDLFVAVRTQRADGHDHVADAWARGAAAVLVDDASGVPVGCPALVVDDTVAAMRHYGAYVVRAWAPRVVAVTGTVGKTGTKELIAEVLATRFTVFRTPGNFSGRFGLAVALGGLRPEHQVAVVEMATGHFGEIDAMCAMTPPEVAVVTAVDAAHLVALGDVDGSGPGEGCAHRPPPGRRTGRPQRGRSAGDRHGRTEPGPGGDVRDRRRRRVPGLRRRGVGPGHGVRRPPRRGGRPGSRCPLLGAHSAGAALAALAVGERFGIDRDDAVAAVGRVAGIPGGSGPWPDGTGASCSTTPTTPPPVRSWPGWTPWAALPGRPRIAVLGDMAELGAASEELHRLIGQAGGRGGRPPGGAGHLGGVDRRRRRQGRARPRTGGRSPSPPRTRRPRSARHLGPDAVVLVKGSAVARMERVVEQLLAEGSDPVDLLVRQDRAWKSLSIVQLDRPTWLEIDLSAVTHNVRRLAARAPGAEVMVVLKADAYGHGAVPVAHTALRSGATRLGVACLPEARALRQAGIRAPVLVLGYTPGWQAREAVGLDLTLAVFDLDTARAFGRAARALDSTVSVHVKVDTGMHRLGVAADEAADFVREIGEIEGLDVAGLFTHFACADDPVAVRGGGHRRPGRRVPPRAWPTSRRPADRPPLVHASNSAGVLCRDDAVFDLVRPGHRRLRAADRDPRWPWTTCGPP